MSEASIGKSDKAPVLQYIIIVILLLAIGAMGFMSVRKYMVKEPTITLQEAQIKDLTEKVNKDPGNPDTRAKLAYAYQMMGQYDLAKEQYLEVLRISPDDLASQYNLGIIAKAEKNYPEAEKYLSRVLELKPNHALGAVALCEIYLEKGEYGKVIETADRALALISAPGKPDLHRLKARAMDKVGDRKGAQKEYEAILKYLPDDREALDALAKIK